MKVFFSLLVTFPMIWVLISLYIPSGSTVGRLAAPFTVTLTDGKEMRLKKLRNKITVVNFWGSWCTACAGEARGLEYVWQNYKNRGVVFLGINVQNDEEADARRYLKKYGITYPNGWDDGSIAKKYSVWGIPKTFVIGQKGKITYVHLGAMDAAQLRTKIDEARKGVLTAQDVRGPYESLNVVRIEELAKLLESSKGSGRTSPGQDLDQEEYRRIRIDSLGSHKGSWVRIVFKNGTQREGKILAVKEQVIQLEEILNVGSFTFHVSIPQIREVQLLLFDDTIESQGKS